MKKPKRITLVLYGLCAVIWSLRVIIGVMYKEYDYSFGFFILNVLAALVWIAAFVKWMLKYRSKKEEIIYIQSADYAVCAKPADFLLPKIKKGATIYAKEKAAADH